MTEDWDRVDGHVVHTWTARPGTPLRGPVVVLLPGLGLPAYTAPTIRTLAAHGATGVVIDVPGFGERGPLTTRPDVHAAGDLAARWILHAVPAGRRLVVVGHSTGSQAALTTALSIQRDRPGAELVMAGPTFMPPHRRLAPLLMATPLAYRQDSLRELRVAPAVVRGRRNVWRLLRSGMADTPERRIADLRLGVTLTAGASDTYAPQWWLRMLAASARRAAYAVVVPAPGSHNNLFTHPCELAEIILRPRG